MLLTYRAKAPSSVPDGAYVILMHADGTVGAADNTDAYGHTIVNGGGLTISTTKSKFGGKSFVSNGMTNSHLTITDNTVKNLGTSDFTYECWINLVGSDGRTLWSYGNYVGTNYYMFDITGAALTLSMYASGNTSPNQSIVCKTGITTNTWHHICLERKGTLANVYVDGVLVKQTSVVFPANLTTTAGMRFCAGDSASASYAADYPLANGTYVDEIRFCNYLKHDGVSFTPETSAYTE